MMFYERCRMCNELFGGELIVQDETICTDYSDEQATLMEEGWYSDDKGTVLCPDCMAELDRAHYDYWAWEFYLEDQGIDTVSSC